MKPPLPILPPLPMPMPAIPAPPYGYCNFCGKGPHEVIMMFHGSGSFICDTCVGLMKNALPAMNGPSGTYKTRSRPKPKPRPKLVPGRFVERDKAIDERRSATGDSLRVIGAAYGLSAERVRGIIARAHRRRRKAAQMQEVKNFADIPIDVLEISERLRNVLINLAPRDNRTLGAVIDIDDDKLLATPNCGRKSVIEWREYLHGLGIDQ